MSDHVSSQEDRPLLLKDYQSSNERKWERIKDLHRNLFDGATTSKSLIECLQSEISLLPKSSVARECDDYLGSLRENYFSSRQKREFEEELVDSYRELVMSNRILQESMIYERRRLDDLIGTCENQKQVLREVKSLEKQSKTQVQPKITSVNEIQPATAGDPLDDLRYVCELLEANHSLRTVLNVLENSPESDSIWSMFGLVEKLVERRSHANPYLSTRSSPVGDDHVDLLCKLFLVQLHESDNTSFKLIDY